MTDPLKCYIAQALADQKQLTSTIRDMHVLLFDEATFIGYDTKEKLATKCSRAYKVALAPMKAKKDKLRAVKERKNCLKESFVLLKMIKAKYQPKKDDLNKARTSQVEKQNELLAAHGNWQELQQQYDQAILLNLNNVQLAQQLKGIKVAENKIILLKADMKNSTQLLNEAVVKSLDWYCTTQESSPECKALRREEQSWWVAPEPVIMEEVEEGMNTKTVHAIYLLAIISILMGTTLMITFVIIQENCCKHGEILLQNSKLPSPVKDPSPEKQESSAMKKEKDLDNEQLSPMKNDNVHDLSFPCVSSAEKPDRRDHMNYGSISARGAKYIEPVAIKLQPVTIQDVVVPTE